MNYGGLAAPLIEAVKELKADNDNLRDLVGNQGRLIEAQGRDLTALRAIVKQGGSRGSQD